MFLIKKRGRYDLTGHRVDIGYTNSEEKANEYIEKHSNSKYEFYYVEVKEVFL